MIKFNRQTKRNIIIMVPIILAILMLDQWTKWWVLDFFSGRDQTWAVNSFFNLVVVRNDGVAFGFLQGYDVSPIVMTFITATVAGLALVVFWQSQGTRLKIALSLAFAGGISNGIDRLYHGAVIDFLDFYYGDYHWPSFNVADTAVSIAIGLLCLEIFSGGAKQHRPHQR